MNANPKEQEIKNIDFKKDILTHQKHSGNLLRKGIYTIPFVFDITSSFTSNGKKRIIVVDNDEMYANSLRYDTFKSKGTQCVTCGIEGKYFAKERDINAKKYHFNLYAINSNGEEVLMTKDHIIAKSNGGTNDLDNLQPMCTICNHKKGNK